MVLKNENGRNILLSMVKTIHENKQYLGDIDGLVGDGDHGMNMNKGFMMYGESLGDNDVSFSDGLADLGTILLNKIGGSMGPIYGTIFMEMADAVGHEEEISLSLFSKMLSAGLDGLYDIVDARPGDKTLVDTLYPCVEYLKKAVEERTDFAEALNIMKDYAQKGRDSTINMIAMYGRASRLGERSKGVLDAGATSCYLILEAMADSILNILK